MKTAKPLIVILIFSSLHAHSQTRKNFLGIGGEFSYPVHAYQSNKAIGLGLNIKGEHFFSSKFSGLASIGYTSYHGKLVYWNGTEDEDFALSPVLIGGRFFIQRFYMELQAGVAISSSENVNTSFTIAPAIGFMYKKLDLAIRLFAIPAMPSIPENTFLEKGGYSYLTFRFFYNLN
jgi:hypothetical protein